MPLTPAAFTEALLREARETHPWLHHPLFHMIWDGKLGRPQLRNVIRQQGAFFLDTLRHAAWKIISVGGYTPTFEDLERQRALIAGRRGGRRGHGRRQSDRPRLPLHQARRSARHLEGRALRDGVPADDDHREERALSPAAHLHAGSAVRREHRHGIDQRDPRTAHGRRHGAPLRRRPDGARLLPRAHGSGG